MHARDHRLRHAMDGLHQAGALGEELRIEVGLAAHHLAEVMPRREAAAGPRDHDDPRLGILGQALEHAPELRHQREAERVVALGAVECDPSRRPVAVDEHMLEFGRRGSRCHSGSILRLAPAAVKRLPLARSCRG